MKNRDMHEEILESIPLLQDDFFKKLLGGKLSSGIEAQLSKYCINIAHKKFTVMVFPASGGEVKATLAGKLSECAYICHIMDDQSNVIAIANFDHVEDIDMIINGVLENENFVVSIGNIVEDMAELHKVYKNAVYALNYISKDKKRECIYYDKLVSGSGIIGNLIGYVDLNYKKDISLEDLADRFNISYNTLSGDFKRAAGGISFVDYINRKRIQEAQKMISEDPHKTIEKIALEVGYLNIVTFNRNFKRIVGTTAGQYRLDKRL